MTQSIGTIIRETREKTGVSQKRTAQILGVDPAMLSRIETGKQIPGWDFVQRCIDRLELQMEDLQRRGSAYKVDPKNAKAISKVLKVFMTLPPKERRRLAAELVLAA